MPELDGVPIDHWIETSGSHALHVRELSVSAAVNQRAILFLHGVFTNGRFFF